MKLSPIVLFVYNRLWHTRQTIESLQVNELADKSDLIIYSDGAKSQSTQKDVDSVRQYINIINGFKSVTIIERNRNWGLADSIVDGVTYVVNKYGKVIVLEDDIVTSPYFLKYMNDALDIYKKSKRVMHIAGYMFPVVTEALPETFFYRSTSCWGWATWKHAWQHYNRDIGSLIKKFSPSMKKKFNLDGSQNFWKQIRANDSGKIKTWAIFWYASVFLYNGLCLHPKKSLVQNIGHDTSGIHCSPTVDFNVELSQCPVVYFEKEVTENELVIRRMKEFYKKITPSVWEKIVGKIKESLKF